MCREAAAEGRGDCAGSGGEAEADRGHPEAALLLAHRGQRLLRIQPFRRQQFRVRRMRVNALRRSGNPADCANPRLKDTVS